MPMIPKAWAEVLSKVQTKFPSAKIAGGALRDTLYGKPVKDVDIFIPVQEGYDEMIRELFPNVELHKSNIYGEADEFPDDTDRGLIAIYTLDHPNPDELFSTIQFDLIVGDEAACDITTFDLSICQVSWDGQELVRTGAFLLGDHNKTIRVMTCNRKDRQAERLRRISAKYPDWKTENPYAN